MLKGLQDQVVLVTGAAGNIGAATVARLLAEGARVVACDLDASLVAAVEDRHGDAVTSVGADVSTVDGVRSCIAAADAVGGLDLAFVNAGVECRAAPVAEFDVDDYERVFAVNVKGAFLTAQAVVRSLTDAGKGGGILFTASIAGLQGGPMTSIYNASKHAVVGLGKCLAAEVGAAGIRVNVLCPGAVDSRMMRSLEDSIGHAAGASAGDIKAGIEARSAFGRYAAPEEVAATAAWILSDEVPYCHGEVFTVGGGLMV
jgi:NAD(P)-dependent dehydrogenase (short-subunit alcohol dehydrogenase family)